MAKVGGEGVAFSYVSPFGVYKHDCNGSSILRLQTGLYAGGTWSCQVGRDQVRMNYDQWGSLRVWAGEGVGVSSRSYQTLGISPVRYEARSFESQPNNGGRSLGSWFSRRDREQFNQVTQVSGALNMLAILIQHELYKDLRLDEEGLVLLPMLPNLVCTYCSTMLDTTDQHYHRGGLTKDRWDGCGECGSSEVRLNFWSPMMVHVDTALPFWGRRRPPLQTATTIDCANCGTKTGQGNFYPNHAFNPVTSGHPPLLVENDTTCGCGSPLHKFDCWDENLEVMLAMSFMGSID